MAAPHPKSHNESDGTCHALVLDPGERDPRPCGRPAHLQATRCNAHEQRASRGNFSLDPIGHGRCPGPGHKRTSEERRREAEEACVMAALDLAAIDAEDDVAWAKGRAAFLATVRRYRRVLAGNARGQ